MPRRPSSTPFAAAAGLVLALSVVACDCEDPVQCSQPADCASQVWNSLQCTADEGHWECVAALCVEMCDPQCQSPADCAGRAWPVDAGCPESVGRWTCSNNQLCVAQCNAPECTRPSDCATKAWPPDAGCTQDRGHWECPAGQCTATCDQQTSCATAMDCVDAGDDWTPPCEGRWTCDTVCEPFCDYATCGNGTCERALGEDRASCPADCHDRCQWPTDCTWEKWTKLCQGRHTCFLGSCQQTCDSNGCGNGVCDGLLGETQDSCFKDCLGGYCSTTLECLGNRWYSNVCPQGGSWACRLPGHACEAVCDAGTCGNGVCDVLAGEAATGCPADCAGYDCDVSADCSALTLPQGCGSWWCVKRNCSPVCP